MRLTFNNRIALVTGAGRGIGKAIAMSLAAEGVYVICVSRSESSCGSVAQAIIEAGGKAESLAVDVSKSAEVEKAAAALLEKHGTIDILVNNAGITRDGLMLRMKDEDWDAVLQTNLNSVFYWCKALAHPMARKRWGRIINISSVTGLMGNAGQVNYAASKAGVIGVTKTLARELAARKITVNAVAPGFIETDMTSELGENVNKALMEKIPLKRLGQPEDIANICTYISSEESGYITGQIFTVDGGMVM
jgi:3-oxoacyl-[acyl-carrier protein] reductase